MQEHNSKEKLTEIIDGLHLQMVWIRLCIDELEALKSINKNKFQIANNFIYITQSSLVYRFTMEIAKLFEDDNEVWSIRCIKNMCSKNKGFFDTSFDVVKYCRGFSKELKQYNSLIDNICGRRNKTYAHNDKDYYLFSQKAIDDFPLDMQEIKTLARTIYDFAKTMQEKIGSKRAPLEYPANSDDVKRLFGEKTADDMWLEENDIFHLFKKEGINE